jgi:DNA repair protein RecN (Recombination protein N)
MLIGLGVRDVVLIERLDLAFGPGLTALTGETGAGKSILLDALGLASGRRADAGLVRRGADQAIASAIFAPGPGHAVWSILEEKGLGCAPDEDLVLRRTLSADGRSRAFVNDQPATVAVLRELSALLLEVHGQHETVGLLDAATHRPLLDAFGALGPELAACAEAWSLWRAARDKAQTLADAAGRSAEETAELSARLAELDRLDPRDGEEAALAEERALLGAAEKMLADISAASEAMGGGALSQRLGQALRALERARDRALATGADAEGRGVQLIVGAIEAAGVAASELAEAEAAIDAAAGAFDVEPDRLDKVEERLFALRAAARRLAVPVDALPAARAEIAARLTAIEDGEGSLAAARAAAAAARAAYDAAARDLTVARRAAGDRLAAAVAGELAPLRLGNARFRVAVGQRLKRLAAQGQVLVVTHSPQIAAAADTHWRVIKREDGLKVRTDVEAMGPAAREEEIARMLSGAEITEAARAAARALMNA